MRLDKLLAECTGMSRKESKQALKKGQVTVNDVLLKDGKSHVDPSKDSIYFLGEALAYQAYYYFMLHKPQGVITATEDRSVKTVMDLLKEEDWRKDLFPVGRLDRDTEGLLLITNDGSLAHELLSPKKHVAKVYEADVSGVLTEDDVAAFRKGIKLSDGVICQPAELMILESDKEKQNSKMRLTICEGKFHQVKRMVKAIGKEVTYLKRVSMGPLVLDQSLTLGAYRPLTESEIRKLHEQVERK